MEQQEATARQQENSEPLDSNVSTSDGLEGFRAAFAQLADENSLLPLENLPTLLQQLHLDTSGGQLEYALSSLGLDSKRLSLDDTLVLCQIVHHGVPSTSGQHLESSSDKSTGGAVHASFSQSRRRSEAMLQMLGAGQCSTDDAVLAYLQRLDEHRKRCELTGRYAEAKAAVTRIKALKSAQADRLRAELVTTQHSELQNVQQSFAEEMAAFNAAWDTRVADYQAQLVLQTEALSSQHTAQMAAFLEDAAAKRPQRPKHSAEYLNNRKIEEKLVKQGLYRKAYEVKNAADAMYYHEMDTTLATYEAEVRIRQSKLQQKQQGEVEALLQRGGRGRDELELRRLDETQRRHNRYRNVVHELDTMHRHEVAHLEKFLEGQAIAGKAQADVTVGEQAQGATMQLENLPANVLSAVTILLDDPAALASTCRTLAAHLSTDALLVEWAKAHAPPAPLGTAYRLPAYDLLHWKRTHTMSTARLVQLLLRLEAQSLHAAAALPPNAAAAQQLLADGCALEALMVLLPHSAELLLLYAAQAGHMGLLRELLAEGASSWATSVSWWDSTEANVNQLVPAMRAAARSARTAALQLLFKEHEQHAASVTQQQRAQLYLTLLQDAIRGGAAECVELMVALCSPVLQRKPQLQEALLVKAAQLGNLGVVRALRDACVGDTDDMINVICKALDAGHVGVLPLLRDADADDADDTLYEADLICRAGEYFATMRVTAEQRQRQLALLPGAMWAIRDEDGAGARFNEAAQGMLHCNSVATLEAAWARLPAHRDILAGGILGAAAHLQQACDAATTAWVVQHAVQRLLSIDQEVSDALAEKFFRYGQLELLAALVEAGAVSDAFVDELRRSPDAGLSQLLHGVRRGDVDAVRAVVAAGRADALAGDHEMSLHVLACAASIADTNTAAAMLRILAPKLDLTTRGLPPQLALAHDGQLLRAIQDVPAFRGMVLDVSQSGAIFQTCSAGRADLAVWAVCRPEQAPAALSDVWWVRAAPRNIAGHEQLLGLTELLHKLAALPASAEWGGEGGEEGRRGQGAPAGARRLTPAFLQMVLDVGMPDLLHGLLAYCNSWGPAPMQTA